MLQSQDIFTEEVIVDELCDFLIAGTQTTQMTTQTVISHFATDPESLNRVRAEFDQAMVNDANGEEQLAEMLDSEISMETCQELSYLGYVI